jgi:hypothetical protein
VEKGCRAEEEEPGVASLSASFVINKIELQGANHYIYYNVTLTELNGVLVNINAGKRCFTSDGNCYDYTPSFVVPASGSITRTDQNFYTGASSDTVTYTYFGTDANSNPTNVSFTIVYNS